MNREFIHPALASIPGPTQVALVRASEEASELIKEVAKALRFGLDNRYPADGQTNTEKIVAEFRDLEEALIDASLISSPIVVSPPGKSVVAGWSACHGSASRLREIHVNEGIVVRLNDTQLEARSPAGAWLPLTLSIIPRPYRLALADLFAHPIEEEPRPQHAANCRIRSGGVCTCGIVGEDLAVTRI